MKIIEEQVRAGRYKIIDFYARINIHYISREDINRFDPDELSFLNVNTWPDYEKALALLNKHLKRR